MVTIARIREAAETIAPHVIRTPIIHSATLSGIAGAPVYLKLENLQKAGSFKVRGALTKIAAVRDRIGPAGVVAASAGNHAQGVALAARQAGVPATIVMPEWVSISKEAATRAYGADVVRKGSSLAESLVHAQALAGGGMVFIHPFDDPAIIAGQGTIGLEIMEDLPETSLIVVPVGGGGLIAGIATAASAIRPDVRIIGAETAACPAASAALAGGACCRVAAGRSIADGILVEQLGALPFSLIRDRVEKVVAVPEERIYAAMLMLLERKKVLAEGAGAVALAALLSGDIAIEPDDTVVLVISGGNIDSPLLERVIQKGLITGGRTMRLSVVLDDVPGALAGVMAVIAGCRGNILHLHHARSEPELSVFRLRVDIEVETTDSSHGGRIAAALRDAGYAMRVR